MFEITLRLADAPQGLQDDTISPTEGTKESIMDALPRRRHDAQQDTSMQKVDSGVTHAGDTTRSFPLRP
jgi:hypothetical protein